MPLKEVATWVGILAAAVTILTRFISLETRAEYTEQIVAELATEVKGLNASIQRLEIRLARNVCMPE